MIKKIAVLLMFCAGLIVFTGCGKKEAFNDDLTAIQQRGELIVGVKTDTKPFGFYDEKGNLVGYDIDLAKCIAKALLGSEKRIKFVPVTPSNRIMKLDSKEVDILIATMSVTNQRKQVVNFSTPYYVAGQAMLVRENSNVTSLKNLAGKSVIIVFGSTSEKNIRDNVPGVVILGYKTYPEAFAALKAQKADAMIADDTILWGYALSDKTVKLLPERYSQEPYAIAFRKSEESEKLETKLDIIINTMISSRRLEKLQKKWGIFNP